MTSAQVRTELVRRDSFFAVTEPDRDRARLYLGLAAQGRSPKVILLRTYLALMAATRKCYDACGGDKNPNNPADPYMTLLGYFGSLRELGGSRRIVEDEVVSKLTNYAARRRVGQADSMFADRQIKHEPVELTSRVRTDKVADAKRKLEQPYAAKDRVDVALATNMISVGLDIPRLGLMVVLGQPKAAAEYIQATSRVGRLPEKPGLVVTILNIHRPRDRSHFERFGFFHETFYRSVEATSVTPFSARALDRGLAGTLVALARHGQPALTASKGATEILKDRNKLEWVAKVLATRAGETMPQDASVGPSVLALARRRLDEWEKIANDLNNQSANLKYNPSEPGEGKPLLRTFLDPELLGLPPTHRLMKFRANRSMRDVEASVSLRVRNLDDVEIGEDE